MKDPKPKRDKTGAFILEAMKARPPLNSFNPPGTKREEYLNNRSRDRARSLGSRLPGFLKPGEKAKGGLSSILGR